MPNRLADAIAELIEEIVSERREAAKAGAKADEHKRKKKELFAASSKALGAGDYALSEQIHHEALKQGDLEIEQLDKARDIFNQTLGKHTALSIMLNSNRNR